MKNVKPAELEMMKNLRVRLPKKKNMEIFGLVEKRLGGSRLIIICEDGKSRMGRIRGKLKKRMWMREGDLVIIKPWEFQNEKADVIFRYTRTQVEWLKRNGVFPSKIA
jgi:translation initiation factor 1A